MDLTMSKVAIANQKKEHYVFNDVLLFELSDYSDFCELMTDCFRRFGEEKDGFQIVETLNLPEEFIADGTLNPNYFMLREVLETLEEEHRELFIQWCNHHNHDLTQDDPSLLLGRFQENVTLSAPPEEEEELTRREDQYMWEEFLCNGYSNQFMAAEIFDENYN